MRISFVYLKATEGGDHKDRLFQQNWAALKDTRLVRGAYHFFTFCRPGQDQASNLLDLLPAERGTLPVAIDLEFGGNCARRPAVEEMAAEVTAFVSALRQKDDRPPVFYVTQEFSDAYLAGHEGLYPDHALWLRDIYKQPQGQGCSGWTFWQYAAQGLVAGIKTPVDLNAYCSDAAAFQKLLRP
ncbi:MAG: GH25 family lysozyme [Hyphomicrobiales bacterium]